MPDGSSGLSLSEMGISSVKKTAGVVKKITTPIVKQVQQQVGGTFIPAQSRQNSLPPNESAPKQGVFDVGALFDEKKTRTTTTQQSAQQMQVMQNTMADTQQKQHDAQQIEMLRKKLHDLYFEEFKRKAEGGGEQEKQDEQKRLQIEQEAEQAKKQQAEQSMEPIMMSQGKKKGFGKKIKTSLMNMIKPKQGSHEGKASKG